MRTLVIGDIHGRYAAMLQVLKRAKFRKTKDRLIVLGDVCDGDQYVHKVIDYLLSCKSIVMILGNHDDWAIEWMETGKENPSWWHQGGIWTAKSYGFDWMSVPKSHYAFLKYAKLWYVQNNQLFVHGGIVPGKPIEDQERLTLLWDRDIIDWAAKNGNIPGYKKVWIGHTTTQLINQTTNILIIGNLHCIDTGAGWTGRLSLCDIHSGEFWQSDLQKSVDRAGEEL